MAKEEQIKTSIDLTGEKEYRAACTNINSSLREIGSEMKLTTAEFADNADSVEALTAKQKLLQKQFDEQAKKAEAAEKALKKMRDNGIEPTNPAYQKMQTNLNNTKADMVKIQKEIDDTSKKLKSSSGIVNALIGNIDQIIMAGVQLFVALIQNLPTIIVEIVKAVPQIVSDIVQAFASLDGEMINAGANLLHGLWEGISGAASWLWEKVSGWASSLVSGIKDFFGIHSPSTVFAEIGGNMADGVGVGFTDNMGGVEGDMTAAMGGAGALTAAEAVNAVNNGIIANIEGLSGAVNAIVERVITGLTAQAQRFNQAGQDFDKNIASGMVAGIVQITQKVPQIAQSIITAFTAQHQKFVTEGTNIDKSIAQGMIAGIPQITGKVAQIIQPIITALRSYVSEFTAAGEEMVRGIWQGFQNMSGWLESRVRSMMRDIVAAVEEEMDINSPSKVFARIGSYMAQGLGEGFAREMRDVESSIRRETSNAVPEFRSGEGRDTRGGGTPSVEVVQNIYANETSYAEQQRQAARQFRQIAREVMA